jgi:hypothetical protein
MKAYGGVNVYIHVFMTWALAGSERSASSLGKEAPVSWVDPVTGVNNVERTKI